MTKSDILIRLGLMRILALVLSCIGCATSAGNPFFQPLGHWTPVVLDQANKTVKVWGREYQFGSEAVLMKQITSQGVNLLAAPAAVQVTIEGDKLVAWGPGTVGFSEITEESVKVNVQATATNASMQVSATMYIEFTGFTRINVSITNSGSHVIASTIVNLPLAEWGVRGVQHYSNITNYGWHGHGTVDVGGLGWTTTANALSHTVFDEKKGISWFSDQPINSYLLKSNGLLNFAINCGPATAIELHTLALPAKPKSPGYADYDYRWAFTTTYYDDATLQSLYKQGYRALIVGENLVSMKVYDPVAAQSFVNRAHAIGFKVLFNSWWWEMNCPDGGPGVVPTCPTIGQNVYSALEQLKPWITTHNIDGYYMDECWPATPSLTSNNDPLDYYRVLKDLYSNLHAQGKGMDRIAMINHNSGMNFMPAHDLWFDLNYKGEDWSFYTGGLDSLLPMIWMELTQYPSNVPKDILSWTQGGRNGPADEIRGAWSICYMFGVVTPVHLAGYAAKVNYLLDNKCNLDNFHGYWQTNPIGSATGSKVKVSGWTAQPGIKSIVSVNNWDESSASQSVTVTLNSSVIGIPGGTTIVKDAETGTVLATGVGVLTLAVNKKDYRLLEISNSAPVKIVDRDIAENILTGTSERVKIFSMSGNLVRTLEVSQGSTVWEVVHHGKGHLLPGTYFFRHQHQKGKFAILK